MTKIYVIAQSTDTVNAIEYEVEINKDGSAMAADWENPLPKSKYFTDKDKAIAKVRAMALKKIENLDKDIATLMSKRDTWQDCYYKPVRKG